MERVATGLVLVPVPVPVPVLSLVRDGLGHSCPSGDDAMLDPVIVLIASRSAAAIASRLDAVEVVEVTAAIVAGS
jgi:hypothetical protein